MKYRLDFVTNSSSSSYILATPYTWNEFLDEKLESVVNEDMLSSIDILKRILDDKKGYITKDTALVLLENYLKPRQDYIKNWESILAEFEDLDDGYYFYELGDFSGNEPNVCWAIESMLDKNEVFNDHDDVKFYYMSNH